MASFQMMAPEELSSEEAARILTLLPELQAWIRNFEEYTLNAALNGEEFPGFKLVEGRSNRRYSDEDAVADALRRAGYRPKQIYRPRALLGLGDMERLVGRKELEELAGEYLIKPAGAPILVPESDRRPALCMCFEG